jgi:hypothetical protein
MRPILLGIALAGLVAGSAFAQGAIVGPSRGEQNVDSLNRSMATQQQNRAAAQQNQFDNNSLRNDMARPSAPLVTPVGPPVGRR